MLTTSGLQPRQTDIYLALLHAGAQFLCSDAAVHLHAGENRDRGPECPDGPEGLHRGPDHPGVGPDPQPVREIHWQHGGKSDAGTLFYLHFPQPYQLVVLRVTS